MSIFHRGRRGAQAMEFALTLPILALVAAATADFGWYFHQNMLITNAAVQGSRAASQWSVDTEAPGVGTNVAVRVWNDGPGADISSSDVTAALTGSGGVRTVSVTVTVPYQCLVCMASTSGTLSHTAVDHYQH